ncbi:MAG TPA: hypothetical protein VFB28_13465 [Terriglobales bacterium]|nr:hypothetical protein [Terriglobales bacterium]
MQGTFCKKLNDNTVPCDPAQPVSLWNLLVTQNSSSPLFANPPNDRFQWQKLFDRNTNAAPVIVAPAFFPFGVNSDALEARASIPVSNIGNAALIIQSVSTNVPDLKFTPASLTIAPQATVVIAVTWPVNPGVKTFNAVLRLSSNDPSTPSASVAIQITVRGPKQNP